MEDFSHHQQYGLLYSDITEPQRYNNDYFYIPVTYVNDTRYTFYLARSYHIDSHYGYHVFGHTPIRGTRYLNITTS